MSRRHRWQRLPVAVLWDQSLVWGLICLETLDRLGIPWHVVTSEDIRAGILDRYRVLLVPGGWASHKVRALGDGGKTGIESFVRRGGSYLGFCGGAGMALSSPPCIGLVAAERKPLSQRLPNAGGEVWIEGRKDHPVWRDMPSVLPTSIWWPSQFHNLSGCDAVTLATYRSTGKDFMVADLYVADLAAAAADGHTIAWQEWEDIYNINLDPQRLVGEPAIVEATLDAGRLILSYPHLDTPDEAWGNGLLERILTYLDQEGARAMGETRESRGACRGEHVLFHHETHEGHEIENGKEDRVGDPADYPCSDTLSFSGSSSRGGYSHTPCRETIEMLSRAEKAAQDLIHFGERHLLWRWRNPWLLNWRRGIRGLEYGTLAVSLKRALAMAEEMTAAVPAKPASVDDPWRNEVEELYRETAVFCQAAKRLLIEEKVATQMGNIRKLAAVNETVDQMREELFGKRMNHGGKSRTVFDRLDGILFGLLKNRPIRSEASKVC